MEAHQRDYILKLHIVKIHCVPGSQLRMANTETLLVKLLDFKDKGGKKHFQHPGKITKSLIKGKNQFFIRL